MPTHDPGPHFDDLLASLLRQSLPTEQYEVLLCDDGSDEATQERLTAIEAAYAPHVRALRLPHTGWPGGPRNAGIDEARGRYLYFCDDDDRLHPRALERLCDYADEHSSDVVLGMLVGVGRWLNMTVFLRDVPHARIGVDPLLTFLTPHKLFRTDFIRSHGIRYPVGKVRLEDHRFVLQAYLQATVCSIYSSYPCYYWVVREDRPSISSRGIDPDAYYRDLVEVLDLVERHTNPSPYRDSLLQHWYRGKVLGRLGGPRVTRYSPERWDRLLTAIRPLLEERFPPRLDPLLVFPYRLRSALLRADHVPGMVALGALEGELTCPVRARGIRWERGLLHVDVEAGVRFVDGTPLHFEEVPGADGEPPRQVWRPPRPIAPEVLTDEVLDATDDLAQDSIQVFLRDLTDQAIYPLTERRPGLRTTFVLDPRRARFGRPLRRRSELLVQVHHAGWRFRRRIRVDDEVLPPGEQLETVTRRQRLRLAQDRRENVLILTARRLPPPEPAPPPPSVVRHPAVRVFRAVLPRAVRRRLRRAVVRRGARPPSLPAGPVPQPAISGPGAGPPTYGGPAEVSGQRGR